MADMMKDKVVVVTGSGGGIGREIALLMAAEGAKVVVNDIGASVSGEGKDVGPAQKVVDEIHAKGGKAVANSDSVATWMSANAIIKTAIDSFGRIDCVINNAGILRDRMFFKMNPEEWQAVIDVALERRILCEPGRGNLFQRTGIRLLRAHDFDFGLIAISARPITARRNLALCRSPRSSPWTWREAKCAPTASRLSPGAA